MIGNMAIYYQVGVVFSNAIKPSKATHQSMPALSIIFASHFSVFLFSNYSN